MATETRIKPDEFMEMKLSAYTRTLYKDFDKVSRTKSLKHYVYIRDFKPDGRKRDIILFVQYDDAEWAATLEEAKENTIRAKAWFAAGQCRILRVPDRDGDGDDDITIAIKNVTDKNKMDREDVVARINEVMFADNLDVRAVELADLDENTEEITIKNKREEDLENRAKATGNNFEGIKAIRQYAKDNSDSGLDDLVEAIDVVFTGNKTNVSITKELWEEAKHIKKIFRAPSQQENHFTNNVLPLATKLKKTIDTYLDITLERIADEADKWLMEAENSKPTHFEAQQKNVETVHNLIMGMMKSCAKIEMALERAFDLENGTPRSDQYIQLFVKDPKGISYTLQRVDKEATIDSLMELIEDKTGIPSAEQSLVAHTKLISDNPKTRIGDFEGIDNEVTIICNLRLKGGHGERQAIRALIALNIRRGNVRNDMIRSAGESTIARDWARDVYDKNSAPSQKIKNWLLTTKSISSWDDWYNKNVRAYYALAIEVATAENCGGFSYHSLALLAENTTGQWIHIITMTGEIPVSKRTTLIHADRKKTTYDHQICLTYPTKLTTSMLSTADAQLATVVDGWEYGKVSCFDDYRKKTNPYNHELSFDALEIIDAVQATGKGMDKDIAKEIKRYLTQVYNKEEASHKFKKQAKQIIIDVNDVEYFGDPNDPRLNKELNDERNSNQIKHLLTEKLNEGASVFEQTCKDIGAHQLFWCFDVDTLRNNLLDVSRHPIVAERLYEALNNHVKSPFFEAIVAYLTNEQIQYYILNLPNSIDRMLAIETTKHILYNTIRTINHRATRVKLLSELTVLKTYAFLDADEQNLITCYGDLEETNLVSYFIASNYPGRLLNITSIRVKLYTAIFNEQDNLAKKALDCFGNEQLEHYYNLNTFNKQQVLRISSIANRLYQHNPSIFRIQSMKDPQFIDFCAMSSVVCDNIWQSNLMKTRLIDAVEKETQIERINRIFNIFDSAQFDECFKRADIREKVAHNPDMQGNLHAMPNEQYATACGRFSDDHYKFYYKSNYTARAKLFAVKITRDALYVKLDKAIDEIAQLQVGQQANSQNMQDWFDPLEVNLLRTYALSSATAGQKIQLVDAIYTKSGLKG